MDKICTKCKKSKPISEFAIRGRGENDYQPKCRECVNEYYRLNYYKRNQESVTKKTREYKKTERGKEIQRKADRRQRQISPEKRKARIAVNCAIARGEIIKKPCVICGNTNSEAHHESYEMKDWLKVIWLCRKHHIQIHQTKKDEQIQSNNNKT